MCLSATMRHVLAASLVSVVICRDLALASPRFFGSVPPRTTSRPGTKAFQCLMLPCPEHLWEGRSVLWLPRPVGKSPASPCIARHPSLHHESSSSPQNLLFQQALSFSAQPLSSKRPFLLSPKMDYCPPPTLQPLIFLPERLASPPWQAAA